MIEFMTAFINSVDSKRDQIFFICDQGLISSVQRYRLSGKKVKENIENKEQRDDLFLNTKCTNLTVKIGPVTDLSDSLKEL